MTKAHFFLVIAVVALSPALAAPACDQLGTDAAGTSSSGGDVGADGGIVRQRVDANALCTRLSTQCGQSVVQAQCIRTYSPLRVSSSCVSGLAQATCADLENPSSGPIANCFPTCSGSLATCNADGTITTCSNDGLTQTYDCSDSCIAQGFTAWTGTCSTSYQGQTSAAPQCWCQ